jgi:hypothetical protein
MKLYVVRSAVLSVPQRQTPHGTRRDVLGWLVGIAAGACLGGIGLARALTLRRVVEADGLGWYPGRVVPLGDVTSLAKWKG